MKNHINFEVFPEKLQPCGVCASKPCKKQIAIRSFIVQKATMKTEGIYEAKTHVTLAVTNNSRVPSRSPAQQRQIRKCQVT